MKRQPIRKTIFWSGRLAPLGVLFILLFTLSCSDSGSSVSQKYFTVAVPSENERYFGEKRDFYVVGYFEERARRIGNIKIELFRGETASRAPGLRDVHK